MNAGETMAGTWLFQAERFDEADSDAAFEDGLVRLLGADDLDDRARWQLACELEHRMLVGLVRPSAHQAARFWHARGQQYQQRGQLHQAYEAFTLCERNIAPDDTLPYLYIHTFLVRIALQQGHYIQSLLSSTTVTAAIQALAPQFIATQRQGLSTAVGVGPGYYLAPQSPAFSEEAYEIPS